MTSTASPIEKTTETEISSRDPKIVSSSNSLVSASESILDSPKFDKIGSSGFSNIKDVKEFVPLDLSLEDSFRMNLDLDDDDDVPGCHPKMFCNRQISLTPNFLDPTENKDLRPFLEISEVIYGSPAWKIGIRPGDFIMKFGIFNHRNFPGLREMHRVIVDSVDRSIPLLVGRGLAQKFQNPRTCRIRVKKVYYGQIIPSVWRSGSKKSGVIGIVAIHFKFD